MEIQGVTDMLALPSPFGEARELDPRNTGMAELPGRKLVPIDRTGEPQKLDNSEMARDQRIREAAEGFEALFYAQMIKEMRKAASSEGLFGDGAGKAVYEGMFDSMMSRELARGGHLGIAKMFMESVT